ncbi:MAG: MFS transporter [Halobacteriales archaeon]|nr:MFS transporter [Halobacteriales archaeon]
MSETDDKEEASSPFRRFLALERDVLVLSVAMFCFSLGFQMTSRYVPRYLSVLGAGSVVIGWYGSFGNFVSAAYPYPGGALSDRVGSRRALTLFGALSSLGFLVWMLPAFVGDLQIPFAEFVVPVWIWVFVGLFLTQAWKSLGVGATFAVVKQSAGRGRLATGFASTETFRRLAFLAGPLLAAIVLTIVVDFTTGFVVILGVAFVFGVSATAAQHLLYTEDVSVGKSFEGVSSVVEDLRSLPSELRPLLVADTLVRFANGMVYVFFVIVVTELYEVGATVPVVGWTLSPDAYFGVLLSVEMVVALLVMVPSARIADSYGLKPVVALGFVVYAVFPVVLIFAPKVVGESALVMLILFAFSGLRFAGLPAHKALIVGPAEEKTGGRVTGAYYLVRNVVVIPSAAVGGWLYGLSPTLAFSGASVVGVVGVVYFVVFGREFES